MSNATAMWVGFSFFSRQEQHREEAVDGVRVLPVAGLETVDGEGVERPERERVAVDDEEGRLFGVRHDPSLQAASDTLRHPGCPDPTGDDERRDPRRGSTGFRPRGMGALAEKMGIEFTEFRVERSVARMPVEGNTQPAMLLHGGAYVVLGESLGSMAANLFAGAGKLAVGIEINATHTRSATSGWVTGVCTPIHLGRTLTTHEIAITDDQGRRCSTIRITNLIKDVSGR